MSTNFTDTFSFSNCSILAATSSNDLQKIQNLVLWGAGLPIETDDIMAQKYNACNCVFMLGNSDPLLSKEVLERDFSRLDKLNFRHDVIWYEGGHKIEIKALEMLKTKLNFE